MKVVQENEFYFLGKNIVSRLLAKTIMNVLCLNKINKLYDSLSGAKGRQFAENYLRSMKCRYDVPDEELANIPSEGGVIIVSNHPTGTFDGILLISEISKVRPDVRFMGNLMLRRVEPLQEFFIEVNPFDEKNSRNISGIRRSFEHVQQGGALVIFPAGEISTFNRPWNEIKDKPWPVSIIRFIEKCTVPVVPLHITASNSRLFHWLGLIHPMLRTAMIPHETVNKRGAIASVRIGTPIKLNRRGGLDDTISFGNYLRANVEALKEPYRHLSDTNELTPIDLRNIAAPVDRAVLSQELERMDSYKLFDYADYSVYFVGSQQIPNMMLEIGRMREITFREIGEGTNNTIDTDQYDTYYHQLFIWDHVEQQLVGAYRVGMGQEIMPKHGIAGFYTDSLFRISSDMGRIMEHTIELGRSFVTKAYQRKPASLMLLWKGILFILLKNESYRYLMGPVTMSGKLSDTSKSLIINFILNNHFDEKLSACITPTVGLKGVDLAAFDYEPLRNMDAIEGIEKIVLDVERGEYSVPILLKKYLQLNGKMLGFNVDPDFNNAIDSLMLLDLKMIPEVKITMLSKEVKDIDVMARFRNLEHVC